MAAQGAHCSRMAQQKTSVNTIFVFFVFCFVKVKILYRFLLVRERSSVKVKWCKVHF